MLNQTARNNQQAIQVDKTLLVYKNIPAVLISNLLGCIPLAFIVWNTGAKTAVVVWLVLHCGLIMVRAVHQYTFQPASASAASVLRYGKINLLFIGLAGGIWGLTGLLFFDPDVVTIYSFLVLTLVCMISGSMSAISSLPPAYIIFSSLTMGPLIVITLIQGTAFYTLMGIGALAYLFMTILFSRNLNRAIHDSLTLKYENLDLFESLRIQTEAAEKANLDKSRFLAAASHDVRQPLHAINLFAHVLEDQLDRDDQRNNLAGVQRGLNSLSELFDALLDVSKIDANVTRVNKTHFRLDEMVTHVISLFENNAREKGIEMSHYDCQHLVHTDHGLLEQILTNLLGNAVRYTHQGRVEVFCDQITDNTLTLHVKDSGIGIAETDLDSIFDEFTQLNNPERDRNKGLGLGLAITHRLTNLLQLPLKVSSEPFSGSDFTVQIQLSHKQIQPLVAKMPVSISKHLAGLKILVVDNEEEIVTGLQLLLKSWQCQVSTSHSTTDALQVTHSGTQPDLVITDYRMPGELTGLELIQSLRQQHPNLAGLIVTGDTSPHIPLKAQKHNLMLLHKPVKPAQLHIAITQTLKRAEQSSTNPSTL